MVLVMEYKRSEHKTDHQLQLPDTSLVHFLILGVGDRLQAAGHR